MNGDLKTRLKNAVNLLRKAFHRCGIWILAVLLTVSAPCLPLLVEFLRNGTDRPDSIFMTTAVLCVGYASSVEHPLSMVAYLAIFILTLIFDTVSGPYTHDINAWAGAFLAAVAVLHASERAYWHIGLDRPFPERISWGKDV